MRTELCQSRFQFIPTAVIWEPLFPQALYNAEEMELRKLFQQSEYVKLINVHKLFQTDNHVCRSMHVMNTLVDKNAFV